MNKSTAQEILKKVKKDYDKIAEEFNATRRSGWKEFDKYLKYIKNGDKIADIGCGNGRLFKYLKQYADISYIGIDNCQKLLKEAKSQIKETHSKFISGNLTKIPLKDGSIDTAVAIASFHHLPSTELRKKSLKEISRILKPEGILILSVWNLFQAKYKKYIWFSRLKSISSFGKYSMRDTFIPWGNSGVIRYYYAFTEKELRKLLKEKFEVKKFEKGNNFVFICKKR